MKHTFEPAHFHTAIGSHEPVLRVADGDTIETWCVDARGHGPTGEQITERGNPQTGPFYIEGAQPGDTLEVRFDRLWPNRARGFSGQLVAPHVVDPWFATELPYDDAGEADTWLLDLDHGTARLEDPPPGLESLQLPLEPMLGCFGVAPPRAQASSALLGQCIRYDVGNVYDPAYTVVAKVQLALLR